MYHHVHAHKILSSENFCKKNSGCFKMLTIYYSFAQLWATFATKLMKRSTIYLYILKLRICANNFTKFHDQQNLKKKKKKKKCGLLFEQYFRQKWSKILRFLWRIFQVRFTFYTVTQVYYDCISTRITAVSMMLTKCYLFQRAYSLPPVFQIFFDLPYTFLDIYNFH